MTKQSNDKFAVLDSKHPWYWWASLWMETISGFKHNKIVKLPAFTKRSRIRTCLAILRPQIFPKLKENILHKLTCERCGSECVNDAYICENCGEPHKEGEEQ